MRVASKISKLEHDSEYWQRWHARMLVIQCIVTPFAFKRPCAIYLPLEYDSVTIRFEVYNRTVDTQIALLALLSTDLIIRLVKAYAIIHDGINGVWTINY